MSGCGGKAAHTALPSAGGMTVSIDVPTHNSFPPSPDHRDWPLFWFARLEAAMEAGNLEQAADAQSQLERLGLRVEPVAPWQQQGGHPLA
jgi:hypothetical protein